MSTLRNWAPWRHFPHRAMPVYLGVDGGGTKLVACFVRDGLTVTKKFDSTAFGSFYELFKAVMATMPAQPAVACLGLAGRDLGGGRIQLTNMPEWGVIDTSSLPCTVFLANDMVVAHRGLQAADRSLMTQVIRPAAASTPAKLLVTTVSTGLNDSLGRPLESGHIGWQPGTTLEDDYLRFGRLDVGSPLFTIEQAIGGKQGWFRMALYMATVKRLPFYQRHILEAADRAGNVSPLIEKWARDGDDFGLAVVELYAGILAGHLRNRVLATLADEIILIGSVACGLADFIAPGGPFARQFAERFNAPGQFADFVSTVPVYASSDHNIPAIGAYLLASEHAA